MFSQLFPLLTALKNLNYPRFDLKFSRLLCFLRKAEGKCGHSLDSA